MYSTFKYNMATFVLFTFSMFKYALVTSVQLNMQNRHMDLTRN